MAAHQGRLHEISGNGRQPHPRDRCGRYLRCHPAGPRRSGGDLQSLRQAPHLYLAALQQLHLAINLQRRPAPGRRPYHALPLRPEHGLPYHRRISAGRPPRRDTQRIRNGILGPQRCKSSLMARQRDGIRGEGYQYSRRRELVDHNHHARQIIPRRGSQRPLRIAAHHGFAELPLLEILCEEARHGPGLLEHVRIPALR